ncbi:unnamed protein product [Adineta steineri]|nr:unnamed protein product [Adineta steineri]CAF3796433.1 unnamed protein product [Adineta steineri]
MKSSSRSILQNRNVENRPIPSEYFSTVDSKKHNEENRKQPGASSSSSYSNADLITNHLNETSAASKSTTGSSQRQWTINDFEIGAPLGRGRFGHVYCVREKKSKYIVALKAIIKDQISTPRLAKQLISEISIQSRLKHPNILRLYGFFHDEQRIFLLLEYAPGGELYRRMQKEKVLQENEAAGFVYQLCNALSYLHSKQIIHRDIKPENILIGVYGILKLADFGWSAESSEANKRTTLCGTLDYLAPEMLNGNGYDEKIDLWCLGVFTYEMIVGKPPFDSQTQQDTIRLIRTNDLSFPSHTSSHARDLISQLIRRNPLDRMPLNEVIQHEWIIENANIKAIDENYEKINKSTSINQKNETTTLTSQYSFWLYRNEKIESLNVFIRPVISTDIYDLKVLFSDCSLFQRASVDFSMYYFAFRPKHSYVITSKHGLLAHASIKQWNFNNHLRSSILMLGLVYVRPDYRKFGIGELLTNYVLKIKSEEVSCIHANILTQHLPFYIR